MTEPITLVQIELDSGTVTFCEPLQNPPFEWNAIPSLRGVSRKPAKINFAGLMNSASPLGVRGAVNLTLQDHAHGDQGTYWGKFLATNTDWSDLEVNILTGERTDKAGPIDVYNDDFAVDTSFEWSLGGQAVDGTISVTGGELVYTVGAGDGTRPRIVREVTVEAGIEHRIVMPAPTGTAPRQEYWISTASGGGFNEAITEVVDDAAFDETFVPAVSPVYVVVRAGTGSTTGDTVACPQIDFTRVTDFKKETYYLEEIDGPDASGRVSISCRDILSRVDGKKAQIPRATDGALSSDITDSDTTITITLPGIAPNLSDYAQEESVNTDGLLQIGDEIMRYSGRSDNSPSTGQIQFFSVERGAYGTTAEAHEEEDKVQWGYEWIDKKPYEVVADALQYWGLVPASWIDRDEWSEEHDRWMDTYNEISGAVIDPTDVDEFVADVLASAPAYIWTDVENKRIRFRAVRPADEDIISLNDNNAFLEGSIGRSVKIDEQVSEVIIYRNLVNLTEDLDDTANYRFIRLVVGDQFGRPRRRNIYSRWLQTETQALQTARSILLASNTLPIYMRAKVGVEYVNQLGPGSVVKVDSRILQKADGSPNPTIFLVVEARRNPQGTELDLTMRTIGKFPRAIFYAGDSVPAYDSASDNEKDDNGFYTDDNGQIDGVEVPYVYA